ncbi:MAG: nucleotide exchange factor GrpE [bacterium]|nr:nucleotide exchange factor GrpE [bacterium]
MNDEQKQNTDESTDDHDDVEIEQDEFVPEDGEGNTQDTVQRLREKLKKAVAEKQEYLDGWQRAKAEFVNARKRDEESRREMMKFANESLIADLIPVLESFEMARANKEAWEAIDKNWRMGVEHIQNQLLKTLQDNGLTEINPHGERFDPMRDEAVSNELVTDEKLDHTIVEVLQKGYSLDGKIIKAPRVKVGEYKKPE